MVRAMPVSLITNYCSALEKFPDQNQGDINKQQSVYKRIIHPWSTANF